MISQKLKLIIVIGALSLIIIRLVMMYYAQRKDVQRLENDFQAQNESIRYYKSLSDETVAVNPIEQLTKNEVKTIYPDIINELDNLKIKLNRVLSFSQMALLSDKNIVTTIHDSVVSDTSHVKTFSYEDTFYTVKGIAKGDTLDVNIQSIDSLIQVVYKGKRAKPYLWFLSKRRLEQVIHAKNPHSMIFYSRYIEITK